MSDGHVSPNAPASRARAGFWRRAFALFIDAMLISVPIQIAVAALYPVTNGRLQISSGIIYNDCRTNVALATLPPALNPPPLAGANRAFICRSSFFGWETARWLTIARVTHEGAITKTISIHYRLDRDNNLTNPHAIDWLAWLASFIYLVALKCGIGTTIGKMLLGLRVIDARQPDHIGIPLAKAILRNLLLWMGVYPMLIVLLGALLLGSGNVGSLMNNGYFTWLMASGLVALAVYVWIVIDVARKRDPIYDVIARTAVVRREPAGSPAAKGP